MRKLSRRELAKRAVEAHWQRTNAVITLKVDGKSMGDTVTDGSSIRVAFSEKPKLRRGDIVYLRRGELRVAHRLILVAGPFCIEKGDTNRYPRPCWRRAILGTVPGDGLFGVYGRLAERCERSLSCPVPLEHRASAR